jgi:hypothetical protein
MFVVYELRLFCWGLEDKSRDRLKKGVSRHLVLKNVFELLEVLDGRDSPTVCGTQTFIVGFFRWKFSAFA